MESELTTAALPRPLSASRRTVEGLPVDSFATRADMGAAAAADIVAALIAKLASQDHVRMIFAAAPSQSDMLAVLCAVEGIDWGRITAFHMDEYIGLSPASPARFSNWLDRHLFDRLPFAAVHRIDPGLNADTEARRYADLLNAAPIDFVCLGIGVNGHIAFNDPPVADFADPQDVKVVILDEICRQQQVDDDCFDSIDDVPREALTLTIPRLMRADRLFCVVPGAIKRDAVRDTLYGSLTTDCPASILRNHASCTLYLDRDSDPDA
jgi:glucosamine-6-phosphate deaminase